MDTVISMKDVWLRIDPDRDWTLRGIDVTVRAGEWITIAGANGSGKSSLLRLMNGLLRPTRGEVLVDGRSTADLSALKDIRRLAGMVFQHPDHQMIGMTVEEETAFGLLQLGVAPEAAEARCRAVLQWLGLLEKLHRPPHLLSGGEKQKLALAGILVMEPKVILLDEAASMLDPQSARPVFEAIAERHRQGCAIVHATHEEEDIFAADRLIVLHQGEIRFDGTPAEAAERSTVFTEAGLLPPLSVRMRGLAQQGGLPTLAEQAPERPAP